MSLSLTTDIILKSVGKRVINSQAQTLGKIIEVTRSASGSTIEYVILKSDDRFFAVPVSSSLIQITEAGEIILSTNREELNEANGTTREQCPSPNFHSDPAIFELYEYQAPKNIIPKNKEH